MPLDLCHPQAPHKKLKIPEWFVSRLMMDRALDAVVRRVKDLDRKHDIPYLAGYSQDGKIIYIDRHMPETMKYGGRDIDTDRFLILHEEVEKTLIDQLDLHYLHAHQIATRAEQAAVRRRHPLAGLRPLHAEIRQAHRRRAVDQGASRSRLEALSRRARLRPWCSRHVRQHQARRRSGRHRCRARQAPDRAAHAQPRPSGRRRSPPPKKKLPRRRKRTARSAED